MAHHPIHPALVHLPIGCFSLATLADVANYFFDIAFFPADTVLLIGIVAAVPAMIAGLVEFLNVDDPLALKTAHLHMALMLTAWTIYLFSYLLRIESINLPGISHWNHGAQWLSCFAFFCLIVGGWLGGRLVYHHGIGVDNL